jgi:hypothetical protein
MNLAWELAELGSAHPSVWNCRSSLVAVGRSLSSFRSEHEIKIMLNEMIVNTKI